MGQLGHAMTYAVRFLPEGNPQVLLELNHQQVSSELLELEVCLIGEL